MYLAVWHRSGSENTKTIRLPIGGQEAEVRCAYPSGEPTDYTWDEKTGVLTVTLTHAPQARLFEVVLK